MLNNSPNRLYFENGKLVDAMVVDRVRQTAQQRRIQRRQLAGRYTSNEIVQRWQMADECIPVTFCARLAALTGDERGSFDKRDYTPDSDDEGLTQE